MSSGRALARCELAAQVLAPAPFAQNGRPDVEDVPDWVLAAPIDPDVEARTVDSWHLVDRQLRWDGATREDYRRYIRCYGDESAVQSESQLSIAYDPSYQSIVFHHLRLRRGADVIDQLPVAGFDVTRPEHGSVLQIYDGTERLIVFPHDLRKGDELDYAYTVRSDGPLRTDHFFVESMLAYGVPVDRLRLRVLAPAAIPLRVHVFGEAEAPSETVADGMRDLVWSLEDIAAVEYEPDTPVWFRQQPTVQVSSMQTWADVVEWALPLYAEALADAASHDAIVELAASVTESEADPVERAAKLLRFVQDDVRYLGIELGEGSYRPSSARETIERRFGDCKDKSVLLVALLDGIGIEAAPALVSSTSRGHVADGLPAPEAFDHVIVRIRIDEATFWVDPTQLLQRGALADVGRQDYGRALVIRERVTDLDRVAPIVLDEPAIDVVQRFALGAGGENAHFTVRSTYTGPAADDMRSTLSGFDTEELADQYHAYYTEYYPDVERNGALEVDEADTGAITITERYVIPQFFRRETDADIATAWLEADGVSSYIDHPGTDERSFPLHVDHPIHARHRSILTLAGGWDIPDEAEDVVTPAMRFDYSASTEGNDLVLEYSYRTFADHVAPEDSLAHVDALDRVFELLQYEVWRQDDTSDVFAVAGILLFMIAGAVSAVMLLWLLLGAVVEPGRERTSVVFAVGEVLGVPLRGVVVLASLMLVSDDWSELLVTLESDSGRAGALFYALVVGGFATSSVLGTWTLGFYFTRKRAFAWLHGLSRCADLVVLVAAGSGAVWFANGARSLALVTVYLAAVLPWALVWTVRWSLPRRTRTTRSEAWND